MSAYRQVHSSVDNMAEKLYGAHVRQHQQHQLLARVAVVYNCYSTQVPQNITWMKILAGRMFKVICPAGSEKLYVIGQILHFASWWVQRGYRTNAERCHNPTSFSDTLSIGSGGGCMRICALASRSIRCSRWFRALDSWNKTKSAYSK